MAQNLRNIITRQTRKPRVAKFILLMAILITIKVVLNNFYYLIINCRVYAEQKTRDVFILL